MLNDPGSAGVLVTGKVKQPGMGKAFALLQSVLLAAFVACGVCRVVAALHEQAQQKPHHGIGS
ncbi:hypothetical protein [Achromobacter deleyi]|uniref:hypothetical protein n=1 Tax=Achromobacter deleyi TaxID=1353891 RepID=UPI001582B2F4|nr:hypothetical protein [Achromobacter deleyi]